MLFCIVVEVTQWQKLGYADSMFLTYAYVLICNILLEWNFTRRMHLQSVELIDPPAPYTLLGRVSSEFAACLLVLWWRMSIVSADHESRNRADR